MQKNRQFGTIRRRDRFEVSDPQSSADCSKTDKKDLKKELKIKLNDDDYYRILINWL